MMTEKIFDNLSYDIKIQLFRSILNSQSLKNPLINYEKSKIEACQNTISARVKEYYKLKEKKQVI